MIGPGVRMTARVPRRPTQAPLLFVVAALSLWTACGARVGYMPEDAAPGADASVTEPCEDVVFRWARILYGDGDVSVSDVASFASDSAGAGAGAGNYRWAHHWPTGGTNVGSSHIDIDSEGNVYVTGKLDGTVDLGGGPITSQGTADIFVLSLGCP